MSKTPEEFLNEIREMDRTIWKMIERANEMKRKIEAIKRAK